MPLSTKQEPPAREIASARKTINEQERSLALSASNNFRSKNYDASLQQLKVLSELRPHDARVAANKAVVEYYVSNQIKTDELMRLLNAAKKQLEFGMVNTGDELDDIDRSFLLYNQAVIFFHLKQYKQSINILERLFKIIEPLGDVLAAKVCTLLVEVYLLNFQLEQAHGMISYIEQVILGPKSSASNEPINEEQNADVEKKFRPKLHMFKVRLYTTRSFYNQAKRELKLAMNSSNHSSEALFLKANVECLRCNFQKSIKLLNSAPKDTNFMETGQPIVPFYYNNMACVHFGMKKYNLAVLYSKKAVDENLAIMKSLPPIEKYNQNSGRPLQTLAINRRAQLVYNLGVSLLFADKPTAAFDCLMESRSMYQCNPRFWLRLAECCIAVSQQNRNNTQTTSSKKNEFVRGVTGTGSHRKIVLSPFSQYPLQTRSDGQSAAMPGPMLDFANLCLSNALLLMPSESELESNMTTFLQNEHVVPGDDDKEPIKRSFIGRIYVQVPPGDPIQTKDAYYLRGSILCCQAYVSLELTDYYKSLGHCKALLRMNHLPSHQRFLARIYLCDSLIKLDKINDAIQELTPENLKSFTTFDQDVTGLKTMEPFPANLNEARSHMMLNVANACCMKSEYDKCKHLLRQVASTELPSNVRSYAVLLSIYCDLRCGNIPMALNLIKRNEVFPSGRLIDRVEAARAMQQVPTAFVQQMQLGDFINRRPVQPPAGFQPGTNNNGFPVGSMSSFAPPGNSSPNFSSVIGSSGFSGGLGLSTNQLPHGGVTSQFSGPPS